MAENKLLTEEELETWIAGLDDIEISESSDVVNGVRVSVSEDSGFHSAEVSQTMSLLDYDIALRRTGTKEISYDQWVDTWWYSWERC